MNNSTFNIDNSQVNNFDYQRDTYTANNIELNRNLTLTDAKNMGKDFSVWKKNS